MIARGGEREMELDAGGQKKQTSSYWINSGDVMYHMMTIVKTTTWYSWKLLREETLKVIITREKKLYPYEMMDVN